MCRSRFVSSAPALPSRWVRRAHALIGGLPIHPGNSAPSTRDTARPESLRPLIASSLGGGCSPRTLAPGVCLWTPAPCPAGTGPARSPRSRTRRPAFRARVRRGSSASGRGRRPCRRLRLSPSPCRARSPTLATGSPPPALRRPARPRGCPVEAVQQRPPVQVCLLPALSVPSGTPGCTPGSAFPRTASRRSASRRSRW